MVTNENEQMMNVSFHSKKNFMIKDTMEKVVQLEDVEEIVDINFVNSVY